MSNETPMPSAHRFIAPRDIIELRLTRLWAEILQRDDIGVKDDFRALGGDHVRAQAVVAAVAARFDAPLTLAEFLDEPTIERLGCRLRALFPGLNEETVVSLQPHGTRPPFFFVPGGEGNVLNFHDLARRMAPDQPLVGLQTRGLYGARAPFARVEDAAADHIESMRSVQPRGPYYLGGHCSGAKVALEMALQLQRRGERVAALVVCDAWSPAVARERMKTETFLDNLVEFYDILAAGFWAWFRVDVGLTLESLQAMAPEQRAATLMDRARRHDVYTPDTTDDRLQRVHALYRASVGYMPRERFRGAITFLRARASNFCETPTEGWEDVATDPLRFREVDGNHVTLLTEPAVASTAREIRAAIAEADAA